jgi:hypothetical protein
LAVLPCDMDYSYMKTPSELTNRSVRLTIIPERKFILRMG